MTLFAQSTEGSLKYTFEWADAIPQNVSLVSVSYSMDSSLTLDSSLTDPDGQTSTIQVSGIEHGGYYVIKAIATLDNSERVPDQQLVIRGFNG